ncbi:hypothetical protein pb186bvf_009046 [Paramecium bursaria]
MENIFYEKSFTNIQWILLFHNQELNSLQELSSANLIIRKYIKKNIIIMGCIQGKKQSLRKSNCDFEYKINVIEDNQINILPSKCQSTQSILSEKLCLEQQNHQSAAIVITEQQKSQLQQEEVQLLYNKKIKQIWKSLKEKKNSSNKNYCCLQKFDQSQQYVVEGLNKEYQRQNQISTERIISC